MKVTEDKNKKDFWGKADVEAQLNLLVK